MSVIIIDSFRQAAFSPLSLSPELWFDASDASTLYDATSGGSLVAADGAIARWEDKSGNARHLTQATPVHRPTRKAAIQNGLDVARFDGAGDYIETGSFAGTETSTRYIVAVSRVSQNKILMGWSTAYATPDPGADYIAITSSAQIESVQTAVPNDTQKITSTAFLAADSWCVIGQSFDGTNAGHALRANGTSPSVTNGLTGNPGTFTKASSPYILAAWGGGVASAQVDIGESILISRALTTDERTALESYLMTKWGI